MVRIVLEEKEREREKTVSVHGWDSFIALQIGEVMATNVYSEGKYMSGN